MAEKVTDIEQHLRDRGVDLSKIRVLLDRDKNIATFPLYNLSGQMVGYQQYNPNGDKKLHADPKRGKYFTYISKEGKKGKLAVWGAEHIEQQNPNLYITEGIFDAIKLINAGLPSVATLSNHPKNLKPWFKSLNKKIIAITDADDAGRKLGSVADESYEVPEGFNDLGDMTNDQVKSFLQNIDQLPEEKMNSDVNIKPIKDQDEDKIKKWVEKEHYLGRWPRAVQQVLGVYAGDKLVGTLVYGIGTRAQSTREIFQKDDGSPLMQNNQMWELQRLYLTPEAQNNIDNLASMSIGRGNEWIRKNGKTKDGKPVNAIISYADSAVGHEGSVYKATNALYLGAQQPLPYYIVTDPKTGKKGRRSKLTIAQRGELRAQGYEVERKVPEMGKHKFVYPLGKKQRHRDQLKSHIVKQLYSYPDDENPVGQPTENPERQERIQQKKSPDSKPDQQDDGGSKGTMDAVLNQRIPNPETGNQILVKTALGYEKNHPMYNRAVQIIKQYQQRKSL